MSPSPENSGRRWNLGKTPAKPAPAKEKPGERSVAAPPRPKPAHPEAPKRRLAPQEPENPRPYDEEALKSIGAIPEEIKPPAQWKEALNSTTAKVLLSLVFAVAVIFYIGARTGPSADLPDGVSLVAAEQSPNATQSGPPPMETFIEKPNVIAIEGARVEVEPVEESQTRAGRLLLATGQSLFEAGNFAANPSTQADQFSYYAPAILEMPLPQTDEYVRTVAGIQRDNMAMQLREATRKLIQKTRDGAQVSPQTLQFLGQRLQIEGRMMMQPESRTSFLQGLAGSRSIMSDGDVTNLLQALLDNEMAAAIITAHEDFLASSVSK